ncbi:hypothetical protein SH139x_002664 [Planctomycetaceae bacterium SH139]
MYAVQRHRLDIVGSTGEFRFDRGRFRVRQCVKWFRTAPIQHSLDELLVRLPTIGHEAKHRSERCIRFDLGAQRRILLHEIGQTLSLNFIERFT